MQKTHQPKAKDIKRSWHLIDAKGRVLGRMASEIAGLLMGKQKVNYAPHMDMGDFVVVINAKDIELTGKKKEQKVYYSHSGYPGGLKEVKFEKLIKEQPSKVTQLAVKRMLPSNRLKSNRMARLKVFAGEKHNFNNKVQKED